LVTFSIKFLLRDAVRLFCIDHWSAHLSKVKDLGANIINFEMKNPFTIIKKETNGKGTICIDAIDYEVVRHMST
jgi:S-(hydroxymethyl)glutathione dehydrogenase / alcohol dehydrogenase